MNLYTTIVTALLFGAAAFIISLSVTAIPFLSKKRKKKLFTIKDANGFNLSELSRIKDVCEETRSSVDNTRALDDFCT